MKRFIIVFSGTISYFPKWLLIDTIGDPRGCVYFNEYKDAKEVRSFYESNPGMSIPISECGCDAHARKSEDGWIVRDAYYGYDELDFSGEDIHSLLEKYAEESFKVPIK